MVKEAGLTDTSLQFLCKEDFKFPVYYGLPSSINWCFLATFETPLFQLNNTVQLKLRRIFLNRQKVDGNQEKLEDLCM